MTRASNSNHHVHLACGGELHTAIAGAAMDRGLSNAALCREILSNHFAVDLFNPPHGGGRNGCGRKPKPGQPTLETNMSNCERYTTVSFSHELFDAIAAEAKKAGKKVPPYIRSVLAAHTGVPEDDAYHVRQKRLKAWYKKNNSKPMAFPKPTLPRKIEGHEAAYYVADYKRRGFSKHSIAALTKLPYKRIEELWEGA